MTKPFYHLFPRGQPEPPSHISESVGDANHTNHSQVILFIFIPFLNIFSKSNQVGRNSEAIMHTIYIYILL